MSCCPSSTALFPWEIRLPNSLLVFPVKPWLSALLRLDATPILVAHQTSAKLTVPPPQPSLQCVQMLCPRVLSLLTQADFVVNCCCACGATTSFCRETLSCWEFFSAFRMCWLLPALSSDTVRGDDKIVDLQTISATSAGVACLGKCLIMFQE